ncbi:MAG: hybrid sensor histidine kinase/response regulator, partial [Moraxellaceae bacterium]
ESDRRKTEFLATLAHELRNPLAPIRTGLELVKLGSANKDVLTQVHATMERQINQMTHLIDDLMDISRINSGKIELKKECLSVKSIVLASVEISLPYIDAANHKLVVNQIPDDVMIDGDRTRLSQVFSNILTNAAKYTPAGGHIEIQVKRDGDNILIAITDNGIGIPTDAIHSVFDMFSQLRRSIDQAHGGLGIGLALANQLIGMHNGTVYAQSEGDGKGSTFSVRLPMVTKSNNVDHAILDTNENRDDKQGFRILVTDDNQDAALMLAELLQALGYDKVAIAHDGKQAIAMAQELKPDVVFLDIGMPEKSGYEVVKELRENITQPIPVLVALTGWGSEKDRERSFEAGFDYHLTKPTTVAALTQILNKL